MSSALYTPFATRRETISLDPARCAAAGLPAWAAQFKLGTAGYRDLLDPADFFNTGVPFNALTAAWRDGVARSGGQRGFNDFRRSTALMQIGIIYSMGLFTGEELRRFSPETLRAIELYGRIPDA